MLRSHNRDTHQKYNPCLDVIKVLVISSSVQHMAVVKDANKLDVTNPLLEDLTYVLVMVEAVVVQLKGARSQPNRRQNFASNMAEERNVHMKDVKKSHEVEPNFVQVTVEV